MWYLYALFAAVLWGLDYAFAEQILAHISIRTFLFAQMLIATVVIGILAFFDGSLRVDFSTILSSKRLMWLLIFDTIVFVGAHTLIVLSIQEKNATVTSLIEISYPLFIILFSWLLFRTQHLTFGAVAGGVLVIAGIVCISLFS